MTPQRKSDRVDAQGISNVLWAIARIKNRNLIPYMEETITNLLPHLKKKNNNFTSQQIGTICWSFGKLTDNWLKINEGIIETLVCILPSINYENLKHDQRVDQAVSNTLWSLGKLIEKDFPYCDEFENAFSELLYCIQVFCQKLMPQGAANSIWAIAKIVKYIGTQSKIHKKIDEALLVLLPHIRQSLSRYKSQGLSNTQWAISKLIDKDNHLQCKKDLQKTYSSILPYTIQLKTYFKPQEIANLIWSSINLIENDFLHVQLIKDTIDEFIPLINRLMNHFKPQEVSNIIWAISSLGELIQPIELLYNTYIKLLQKSMSRGLKAFSSLEVRMTLWGLLVLDARIYQKSDGMNRSDVLLNEIKIRYNFLKQKKNYGDKDISLLAMTAAWLKVDVDMYKPVYQATCSSFQSRLYDVLKDLYPNIQVQQEISINSLPPVDICFPELKLIIEVQGPHHFIDASYHIRNGNTLLKNILHKSMGYRVVEFPVSWLDSNQNLLTKFIESLNIE